MSEEKKINAFNLSLIKRILSYTNEYRKLFLLALFITLFLSALSIARPLLISEALTNYVEKSSDVSGLTRMCLIILGFIFLEAILQYFNTNLTNYIGQSIIRNLRIQLYRHVIHLKSKYYDKTPVGMLVTRVISDIESLSDVFSQGFIVILGDIFMLVVFISAMLYKNWVLALLVFTTIPLLMIATNMFKKGVKKTFTMVRNAVSELNAFVQERLSGMIVIQLFNKEEEEFQKFEKINRQHRDSNIKSIFYYSVFFPVVEILSSVSIALMIWFAGNNYEWLNVTLGDLTFFLMLTHMMFRPIRMLADRLNTLQMGIVSAERVFKVLDTEEKISDKGTTIFESLNNGISFKNVDFHYNEENPVLINLNLKINKGDKVAFVGSTGSGKTTIINLLSRYYEINGGSIEIDSIDIRDYKLQSLRKNTGVVLQDVFLFNDSIYNNIALFDQSITRKHVENAIKEIGLQDFINDLPGGLDYVVKERGISLSAGQRQLVAFIRAYVYNPDIFVLDEATASIDTPTEMLIQKALSAITKNRTSIIIAHRLSTIMDSDKIYVLKNGKIIEEGNPKELLKTDGEFSNLYNKQLEQENPV
ncbi:MAG: ABC transporter ATP-binding protein [Bacteroidia bacterium]